MKRDWWFLVPMVLGLVAGVAMLVSAARIYHFKTVRALALEEVQHICDTQDKVQKHFRVATPGDEGVEPMLFIVHSTKRRCVKA